MNRVFFIGFFLTSFSLLADISSSQHAELVLNTLAYELPSPSIIGDREWKELQLDRLVTVLDRTKTPFGRWGLVQLLHPINDEKELSQRKKIISFLIDNEKEMAIFQKQLERVRSFEQSLLAYWDEDDQLASNSRQFYYESFGLKKLNKSSLALEIGTLSEVFNSFKILLSSLALAGVSNEFRQWLFNPDKEFDLKRGIEAGLQVPFDEHNPNLKKIKPTDNSPYSYKDYVGAYFYGTWGDRYEVFSKGSQQKGINLGLISIPPAIAPGLGKVGAFVAATIPTLVFDYNWINFIISSGKRIMFINRTLTQLQTRVSDVAQCIDAMEKLRAIVNKQVPQFRNNLSIDDYDSDRQDFIQKLLAPRFLEKSEYLYSRGHVLAAHLEISQNKKKLIPLLQSVALLDAYCSIAQLYKENQNKSVQFSFPEFVHSATPFFTYQDAWLPLLSVKKAVSNDLMLGGKVPGKIVITGPNGGGKSTILKTYGIAAILAQSWCIVPAKNAQQALFASIRTSLAPREDLEHGLSTFTADQKVMAELLADIKSLDDNCPMLVLIDEPYQGTVESESAKHIYQFGKDIASYPQALVAIATHVKKPISLAQDTGGIFGNYQIKIREVKHGVFERLFKLEPGPATWWFEDENQRSRFVDWISVSGNFKD
jgi:energy-coupling factor transporter ATP-binding protein EcfA2